MQQPVEPHALSDLLSMGVKGLVVHLLLGFRFSALAVEL